MPPTPTRFMRVREWAIAFAVVFVFATNSNVFDKQNNICNNRIKGRK